jgi:hypothetical protein
MLLIAKEFEKVEGFIPWQRLVRLQVFSRDVAWHVPSYDWLVKRLTYNVVLVRLWQSA